LWAKYGLNSYFCKMPTINFLIQSKSNPSGIYARLKEGASLDIKAKTKFAINPSDWSSAKGLPKIRDEHHKPLTKELLKFKSNLLDHYNESVGKIPINTQWLKDFINPPVKSDEIPTNLLKYFDYYVTQRKNDMRSGSIKKLNVQKHLLEKFQKETKVDYFIIDVNADFKAKFEEFCLKKKYSINTIARSLKSIKTVCYHARTNGISSHPQLDAIKVKTKNVEKIYLTFEELEIIEKAKLDNDNFLNARDWLLISCETGQRVSDFLKFKKEQIRYENGKALIEFTQVKTGKIMTVPLSERVKRILKQRNGDFPKVMSDQKYNLYIKGVCCLAGLKQIVSGSINNPETNRKESGKFPKWQLVSSHIGRRSFATNWYGTIPTSLLINATGHSTEKQFLEYIGKSNSEQAMQLAEYF
jgi:integrase